MLTVGCPIILDYSWCSADEGLAQLGIVYVRNTSPSMLLISSLAISLFSSFFTCTIEMKLVNDSLFKYLNMQYVFLVKTLIFYQVNIYFSFFIFVSILLWLSMTRYLYRLISKHFVKMTVLRVFSHDLCNMSCNEYDLIEKISLECWNECVHEEGSFD